MKSIAKLSSEDRKYVFFKTSELTGKSIAIIEKDYWICYLIDYLFNKSEFKDMLIFKGGTSLSKGFDLIKRMSEDIDLVLNWRLLGEEYNIEKWENDKSISKTKIENNKNKILKKTNEYLKNTFVKKLSLGISADLGYEINISCHDENKFTVIYFNYPKIAVDSYLLDVIKLEIGPIAALEPTVEVKITPYCTKNFEYLFTSTKSIIKTVTPERTFWEKATILHKEALRPNNKLMPTRYSRHYYDLYMLGKSKYKDNAINDLELLKQVIHFNDKFYKESWMEYSQILEYGIKLVPEEFRIKELRKDYENMKAMIQDFISFDSILLFLKDLEIEINDIIKENKLKEE